MFHAHVAYTVLNHDVNTCMAWRTPVSRPSACVAFAARRRWRPAGLLGSPGPPRSTHTTVIRRVWCTRVSRTSVCVVFGACSRCNPVGPRAVHRPNANRTVKRPHAVIEEHLLRPNRPSSRATSIIKNTTHGQQQQSTQRSGRICSVGGRAVHMKWPDGIRREAESGQTRHVIELSLFRACPL